MSYEKLCEELYNERIAQKSQKELRRQKFRQSVIDRQLSGVSSKSKNSIKPHQMVYENYFVMPDTLPNDIDKLKWLIFQNIEIMQKEPVRTKEAKENIKAIKSHIGGLGAT